MTNILGYITVFYKNSLKNQNTYVSLRSRDILSFSGEIVPVTTIEEFLKAAKWFR